MCWSGHVQVLKVRVGINVTENVIANVIVTEQAGGAIYGTIYKNNGKTRKQTGSPDRDRETKENPSHYKNLLNISTTKFLLNFE